MEREVLWRFKAECQMTPTPKRTALGAAFGTILADAWTKDERGHYPKRVAWTFGDKVAGKTFLFRLTLTPLIS